MRSSASGDDSLNRISAEAEPILASYFARPRRIGSGVALARFGA
jgi:hypothetical protein